MRKTNNTFFKDLGHLTGDYWRSKEKWPAGGLLATIICLNLGSVYLLVLINEWNNGFYNALQHYNQKVFLSAIGTFSILATIFIIISVYELYFQQMLEIRWRRWMTEKYLQKWLHHQVYYRLPIINNHTDNPDQRISEDIRLFVAATLTLSFGLLKAAVTLISFTAILWRLSGSFTFPFMHHPITITGYMVWAAIGYAVIGTWLAAKIGRPLVKLNFEQQCYEADFRFSLVRLRENAESIAFYRGELPEQKNFYGRFQKVFENFQKLMRRQKRLTWLTSGYDQIAIIFPLLMAAPRFFSNQIQLGGLIQTAAAFGKVQDSLSFFVDSYASLAEWRAVVNRLVDFNHQIDLVQNRKEKLSIQISSRVNPSLVVSGLEVSVPGGAILFKNLDLRLELGESLLITGPSGSGKSTLLRTLAGIWPFAQGEIKFPQKEAVLFLPQKPYLPLGTLREVLLYPQSISRISDQALREVMAHCRLAELVNQLDTIENWSQILSLGEQQRVAFARVLLQQPQWLFLDEATSALDEPTEYAMYGLLHDRLKDSTTVSVGHRPALACYHRKRLHLDETGHWTLTEIRPKDRVAADQSSFCIV